MESLYLFGSHARDDARDNSDIDVFIDPKADVKFGFDAFMEGYELLQQSFGSASV